MSWIARLDPCRNARLRKRAKNCVKWMWAPDNLFVLLLDQHTHHVAMSHEEKQVTLVRTKIILCRGHDMKLALLDYCIIFNNNFGSATTYAYATLGHSVAGNSPFRGIVFCNLGIPKIVISTDLKGVRSGLVRPSCPPSSRQCLWATDCQQQLPMIVRVAMEEEPTLAPMRPPSR